MKAFKNRRSLLIFMLFVVLFILRVTIPYFNSAYIWAVAGTLVIVCVILGGGIARGIKNALFVLVAIITALSSVIYAAGVYRTSRAPLEYADSEKHGVYATITDVSYVSAYASSYVVKVTSVDGESVKFSAVLDLSDNTSLKYGDIVFCESVFEEAIEESAYLRGKNIFVRLSASEATTSGEAPKGIAYYLYTANEYMSQRMRDMIGAEGGGLCAAFILGDRSHIDSGTKLDFSRVGISHLLALSGLHLSVFASALDMMLRGFMKKRARNIICIAACFAFALFTGLSVSVLRASIMLSMVFVADMVGEENDSVTALFFAAFIILLVNGNSVYDVGFWLSFSATLGILLTSEAANCIFSKWQKPKKNLFLRFLHSTVKYFYGIFSMSIASSFFTLPVVAFVFNEVSIISSISNFVFIPLATVLLLLCIAFVPLSFVPYLSNVISFLCSFVAKLIIDLASKVSEARGIFVSLNYPFAPYLFVLLALCLIICIFVRRIKAIGFISLVLSFAVVFSVSVFAYDKYTKDDMSLTVYGEGTKEAVIFSVNKENYVIDISTGGYSFIYESAIGVKEFADTELDNLVLTHYHIYHSNTLYRLSKAIKIRNLILPEPETDDEAELFEEITALAKRLGISYETYKRGGIYARGDISIDFAPLVKLSRSQKPIVAFSVKYKGRSFSYVEGAAFESEFDYKDYLSAETVFIGSHGPLRKKSFSCDIFSEAGRVVFADGVKADFENTQMPEYCYDISEYDGKIKILYDN